MAILKNKVHQPDRPDMTAVAVTFHDVVDGVEAFVNMDEAVSWFSLHGIEIVSPRACSLDPDYKPVSRIEKCFEKMFPGGGLNDSDDSFSIEKDGYETAVFEHNGQMFCSDWILDRESGKIELVSMPDRWEELLKESEKGRRYAVPCDEVITGDYARVFVTGAKWNQALDFKVPDWPEFVGLRYKDFDASRAVHAKLEDGSTVSLNSLGIRRTGQVIDGLKDYMKAQRRYERRKLEKKGISM